MNLTAIRRALKDALSEIDNAGVSVAAAPSDYTQATQQFLVRVLVGPLGEDAEERLDALLAPTGEDSVKEAIETRTAGVADLHVPKHSGYRVYAIGPDEQLLGAEWSVDVLV